jgi:hypothetical protein
MRPDSQLSTNKQDLKPLFFSMPWSSLQQPVDVTFHAASGSVQLGNSSGNNAPSSLNVHQSRNSNKPPFLSSPSLRQPVDVEFHTASGSVQLGNSSGNNAPSSLNVHQSRNSNKLPYFFLHERNGTKTMFKKYKIVKLLYLQLER